MKLSQIITGSSLLAVALLNVSASAFAAPITVTRGPNSAAHVVKSDNISVDAKALPTTEDHGFPTLTTKGPGGAAHILNAQKADMELTAKAKRAREVRSRVHGALYIRQR